MNFSLPCGAADLYMADFSVEAREVEGWNYMRQMVFVDCDNVYTYRVNLNIPQETFSKDYFVDKQYSSLTYYSGNKNMTLDSCKLELMCSTYRGANLGVLDFLQQRRRKHYHYELQTSFRCQRRAGRYFFIW